MLRCATGSRSAPSDRAAHLSLALQPYHGLSNIGVLMGEQLASSGVDTLIWLAGVEGGNVIYDSKVAPLWGSNVETWTHPVWFRGWKNPQALIAEGHDPLALLCNNCR